MQAVRLKISPAGGKRTGLALRPINGEKNLKPRSIQLADRAEMYPKCLEPAIGSRDIREMLFGVGAKATHRILFLISSTEVYIAAVYHVAQEITDKIEIDDDAM